MLYVNTVRGKQCCKWTQSWVNSKLLVSTLQEESLKMPSYTLSTYHWWKHSGSLINIQYIIASIELLTLCIEGIRCRSDQTNHIPRPDSTNRLMMIVHDHTRPDIQTTIHDPTFTRPYTTRPPHDHTRLQPYNHSNLDPYMITTRFLLDQLNQLDFYSILIWTRPGRNKVVSISNRSKRMRLCMVDRRSSNDWKVIICVRIDLDNNYQRSRWTDFTRVVEV